MTEEPERSDQTTLAPWCVIPVYNHAQTAVRVARDCRARMDRVLVVDDGSDDADLRGQLAGTDIHVLRHDRNRGKGEALRTALRYVAEQGGTHMITIDADGQHLAEDLPRFLEAIRDAPDAIVIGCRDFTAPHIPDGSRFGRRFSNFWVRLETGKALDDTQSGFRAYPVAWIQRLPLVSMRYDFEIEALVRALWAGLPVREVPVQVIYPPPGERVSHFHPFRDNARLSRLHARLVGRSLAPWPHRRLIARPPEESLLALLRHPARTMRWFLAENVTAEGLAAAAAVGSFLGVLPLISCHTAVILFAATRLHVNRALALAIQNLYMPPFTPFLCIQLGHYFRYGEWWTVFTRETLVENVHQRLYEWLLGSLVLAPIFAVLAGLITYLIARGVRRWPRRGTA